MVNEKINKNKLSKAGALKILVQEDIKGMLKNVPIINSHDRELKILKKNHVKLTREIKKWGFNIQEPPVNIVEKYPKPYHKKKYLAMAFDSEDKIKYGINPQICFLKSALMPIHSSVTLAHEFIHFLPASVDAGGVPQLSEEGLAQLLGDGYLADKVLPKQYGRNWLINARFSARKKSFDSERYFNGLRMACMLYLEVGLKGIISMFKQGRPGVFEVENKMLAGEFTKINLPKGNFASDLNKFAKYILIYPRFLELSPIAFYITRFIRKGDCIKDIKDRSSLTFQDTKEAINEVWGAAIISVCGEKITSNEVGTYLRGGVIKYKI